MLMFGYCASYPANADIFLEPTLRRLSGGEGYPVPRLQQERRVLALLKWVYNAESETMSLNVRTDSQGVWRSSISY